MFDELREYLNDRMLDIAIHGPVFQHAGKVYEVKSWKTKSLKEAASLILDEMEDGQKFVFFRMDRDRVRGAIVDDVNTDITIRASEDENRLQLPVAALERLEWKDGDKLTWEIDLANKTVIVRSEDSFFI